MPEDTSATVSGVRSMTGFASQQGNLGAQDWTWEIKGVNGRGLDLRLRLPDRIDGLEVEARKRAQAKLARGNVTIGLRLTAADEAGSIAVDTARLASALDALETVAAAARARGLDVQPVSAADIAGIRGVLDTASGEVEAPELRAALLGSFDDALAEFIQTRATEGQALAEVLSAHLSTIEQLAIDARAAAAERPAAQREAIEKALRRLNDEKTGVSEDRLAQELALIAIKQDVTEELDRLDAHVAAARVHLTDGGAIGRKLDFLMQEFNREANTLCSKAQSSALTSVGLELKAVIDQMREQVQNVE